MRARYEITPPAARLAVKLFQANDTGGTLKGHGEKQHAVFQAEFLGFLVGGVIRADAHSVRVSAPSITSALRVDLGARKVS